YNNKINLVVNCGILCGLIGLSNMAFGMNGLIVQAPITIGSTTLQLLVKDENNFPHPFWLNNNKSKNPLDPIKAMPILFSDTIDAVLVRERPDQYSLFTSDAFTSDTFTSDSAFLRKNSIEVKYTEPKYRIPLEGFLDRSFGCLQDYEQKGSINLVIRDPKNGSTDSAYCVKSVIDNTKKGIMFYCGIGFGMITLIGAILFYLGKLPQF